MGTHPQLLVLAGEEARYAAGLLRVVEGVEQADRLPVKRRDALGREDPAAVQLRRLETLAARAWAERAAAYTCSGTGGTGSLIFSGGMLQSPQPRRARVGRRALSDGVGRDERIYFKKKCEGPRHRGIA